LAIFGRFTVQVSFRVVFFKTVDWHKSYYVLVVFQEFRFCPVCSILSFGPLMAKFSKFPVS
jgi:hypothetical protein